MLPRGGALAWMCVVLVCVLLAVRAAGDGAPPPVSGGCPASPDRRMDVAAQSPAHASMDVAPDSPVGMDTAVPSHGQGARPWKTL